MKNFNIILIAEEGQSVVQTSPAGDGGLDSQVNFLQGFLNDNPGAVNDPQFQEVIKLSEAVKQEEIQLGLAPNENQNPENKGNENQNPENKGNENQNPEGNKGNPLSSLPFFKSEENNLDLAKVKVEDLPNVLSSLKIDTSKENWITEFASAIAPKGNEGGGEYETKFNELVDSISLLPKEIQMSIQLYSEKKDWKEPLLSLSNPVDLTQDYSKMSLPEKIKVHNFYFPEDKIEDNAEATNQTVAKALKVAESKFNVDKQSKAAREESIKQTSENSKKAFVSSVDSSLSKLKKDYPDFKEKEFKEVENIIKNTGIHSVFFNKDGTMREDAAKRLTFALRGEEILQLATSLAGNRAASKAKAEILETTTQADLNVGKGGTKLTDEERAVAKFVNDSMVSSNLTY